MGSVTYVLPGTFCVGSTDKGNLLAANANAGGIRFKLPPAVEFGCGEVMFKKIDRSSNLVDIYSPTYELEDCVCPSIALPLQFDSCTLMCDGVSKWWLVHQNLAQVMHNAIAAEHTVTSAVYFIDRTYCGYIMLASPAGGCNCPIMMVLPRLSDLIQPGSHTTWMAGVMKFPDGSPHQISVVTLPGDTIADPRAVYVGPAQCKIDIVVPCATFWFWSDGARYIIPYTNGLQ